MACPARSLAIGDGFTLRGFWLSSFTLPWLGSRVSLCVWLGALGGFTLCVAWRLSFTLCISGLSGFTLRGLDLWVHILWHALALSGLSKASPQCAQLPSNQVHATHRVPRVHSPFGDPTFRITESGNTFVTCQYMFIRCGGTVCHWLLRYAVRAQDKFGTNFVIRRAHHVGFEL